MSLQESEKQHTELARQNALFKEAALPLIKYLCENYHPHVTVIVTPTSAELMEGLKAINNVTDFIKD